LKNLILARENRLSEEALKEEALNMIFPPIESEEDIIDNLLEVDGEEYLAGFMAKKLRQKFEYMGDYSYNVEKESYTKKLSLGGLIIPSDLWMKQFKTLEKYFIKYHGDVTISKFKWENCD
jgi:87kDa Transposase